MNIFAVSDDVITCAQSLDDKRLVKMLTETCQLLSTARISKGLPAPYRAMNKNHPACLWAAKHKQHRCWLGALIVAYYQEYRIRFNGRDHLAWNKFAFRAQVYKDKLDPLFDMQFVNCARHSELGVDYSHMKNVHAAYRNYLCHRWRLALEEDNPRTTPTFTNRKPPKFSGWLATQMDMK